jgi:YidC/Oxa1 family membrane protein insertase
MLTFPQAGSKPNMQLIAILTTLQKGGETASTTASPRAMKIMQVALPAITLAITSFMPAAVQISFLVSGILSLVQTTLFRRPAFRSFFKMYPLPSRNASSSSTPSPYKGTMNVRAPLTQNEFNNTYQQGRSSTIATTTSKQGKIRQFVTGSIQGAAKDIKTTFTDARQSAMELAGKSKDSIAERQAKNDRAAAAAYEEKRKKEIEQERYNREQYRRTRRAYVQQQKQDRQEKQSH